MNVPSVSFSDPVALAVWIAGAMLALGLVMGVWRLIIGPTSADRVMALDLLTGTCMALTVFLSIRFDHPVFLDVALAFAVVGFLSTAILARVMERRANDE